RQGPPGGALLHARLAEHAPGLASRLRRPNLASDPLGANVDGLPVARLEPPFGGIQAVEIPSETKRTPACFGFHFRESVHTATANAIVARATLLEQMHQRLEKRNSLLETQVLLREVIATDAFVAAEETDGGAVGEADDVKQVLVGVVAAEDEVEA